MRRVGKSETLWPGLRLRDRIIGVAIIGVPLVMTLALGATFLRRAPFDLNALPGCYTAERAPPLAMAIDTVRIVQPGQPVLVTSVTSSRRGHDLLVEPAWRPEATADGRYVFRRSTGSGYFWDIQPALAGAADRQPWQFAGRIDVRTSDGRVLEYRRQDGGEACSPAAPSSAGVPS